MRVYHLQRKLTLTERDGQMERYDFTITIGAEADTPEEAWLEAIAALALEPGIMPDEYDTEEID